MKRSSLKQTNSLKKGGSIKKTGRVGAAYDVWKHEVAIPYLLEQNPRRTCYNCGTDKNVQVGHILPRSTHPHLKMEVTNVRWECLPLNYYGQCYESRPKITVLRSQL